MGNKSKNSGFTLAEVLIVLAIIGVLAAMLIPSLVQKFERQEWLTALKKTYSTLANAQRLTSLDYGGDISVLYQDDDTFGNLALQAFAKHLNISKNCGTQSGCLYNGVKYKTPSEWETADGPIHGKAILTDGTMLDFYSRGTGCEGNFDFFGDAPAYKHYCDTITVDINGAKGPNAYGRDVFVFDVTRDGVYPEGTNEMSILQYTCKGLSGLNCAARAIKDGNMDYLDEVNP